MHTTSFYAITNRGRVRDNNEDNFYAAGYSPGVQVAEAECVRQGVLKKKNISLFAVCDGMGGMNAGEVASAFVVEAIRSRAEYIASKGTEECAQFLDGFLSEQNEKLYALSKTKPELDGMGTTFVGLCIAKGEDRKSVV